jgi:thioredoxin 1
VGGDQNLQNAAGAAFDYFFEPGETDAMNMADNTTLVTDETFEAEIEKHSGLAVVDFWATWCGPCRAIAPILEQLAAEHAGKLKVAKLDVDTNIKTSTRFNVRSIPLLLFFKDGKVVDQIVGAVPKATIESKISQHAA